MTNFPRYAIYFAPLPGSDLDRFGSQLLGYDAFRVEDVPFPQSILASWPDWHGLTTDPRKYGFHATLKAPMSLAPGKTEAELVMACEAFAYAPRPVPVIKPVVGSISGFVAVIPAEPVILLEQFASDCVREFESFRAPLTTRDRERRNPAKLTLRQREHLDRWGYPYVMQDFRFHMTLTGRLTIERHAPIQKMLRRRFSTLGLTTLAIDGIALFRQNDAESRFQIIKHFPLRQVPNSPHRGPD